MATSNFVSSNQIRATFLDYFARNGHQVVDSSPLVPRNDPTLMFANSGMVQFKNVFTGQEKRAYSRATTAQKCVRAGGKHNDLDNVGYTARHLTFFEMLGNFSFGDYFKEQAITHAWTLLTRDFAMPKDRLTVTVYSEDEEAAALWRKIAGLPDERIIRIPTSDNFWRMGDTGPCGPCSEIFYDHGPSVPGGPPGSPDEDGDRFVEIWNLVFMQYEEGPPGTRVPLPRPSIDTGMGMERFAAILQNQQDIWHTDTLRALILASAEAVGQEPDGPFKTSHRVVADHLRSTSFLMAEGVLPSNEGRGYVLRRIMRRAMRHAHMMGAREPVMHLLVPALIRQMGAAYPELGRAETLIADTMRLEETRFKAMLERGLGLLADETGKLGEGQALAGDVAFKLYDTFGFPLDLTQDALREQGRAVDVAGFDAAMAEQRRRARAAWAGSGEAATETVWFELKQSIGATEFLGYTTEAAEAEILALVVGGNPVDEATAGQEVAVILNQTPFYGESGGQVGDTGVISAPGLRIVVTDTQKKLGDLFVHLGRVEQGTAARGRPVVAVVDHARRTAIRAHHSATHLLHEALRRRLGPHVQQKGSLNAPDRLRFDVSQPTPIGRDDLAWVEREVNARIRENSAVTTRLMTPEAAVAEGAMALFGEKYGDEVRVVAMGDGDGSRGAFSIELCGGTHVRRTGDIGLLRITNETAVSAGVRRIEAVTGEAALTVIAESDKRLAEAAAAAKANPAELAERVTALMEDRRRLERQVASCRKSSRPARRWPRSKPSATASRSRPAMSVTFRRGI
jgi:alanyl-tRNA synthetase